MTAILAAVAVLLAGVLVVVGIDDLTQRQRRAELAGWVLTHDNAPVVFVVRPDATDADRARAADDLIHHRETNPRGRM